MTRDANTELEFDPKAYQPGAWFTPGDKLKISAEILKEKMIEPQASDMEDSVYEHYRDAYFQSFMLIMGFFIENFLKGLSIEIFQLKNKMSEIPNFRYLVKNVWKCNGHDLTRIALTCDVKFNKDEWVLLKRYTEFTVWAGRYHIPLTYNDYLDAFQKRKLRHTKKDKEIILDYQPSLFLISKILRNASPYI